MKFKGVVFLWRCKSCASMTGRVINSTTRPLNLFIGASLITMKLPAVILLSLVVMAAGVAMADSGPSVSPQVTGTTVPAWVFYWVLGLSSAIGASLLLVIKILWDKSDRKSGLSEEERNRLNQLYEWHNKVDDDQVPLWYIPRAWINLIRGLQSEHAAVKDLLTRIAEQNDGVNSELRQQVREGQARHDRLYAKMLRLAVRVQQAVEALAGLETSSVEILLDAPDEDN